MFETRTISSLCLRVTSGGTPSRKVPEYWEAGSIPWVKTGELKNAAIYDAEEYITKEGLDNSSAKIFPENTVLMAMYGDGKTITNLGITKNELATNQACCALIVNPEVCDYRFLFYSLQIAKNSLLKLVVAGAQRNLSTGIIKNFNISVPNLETQTTIANILSAYDDLIENNRRRIQILEESARLLYREWFVHLRFPGHEKTKIIDGVPEGWERCSVPDVINLNPTEKVEKGSQIRYLPMSCLSTDGMTISTVGSEIRTKSTAVKFRNHDTLLARITPCLENGKTGFVSFLYANEVACGSTEFIVMRGQRVSSWFTYCLARDHDFRELAIKSMTGSSGRQRVQKECFNEYLVPLAPEKLLKEFDEIAGPIFLQIQNLVAQSKRATESRDLLLPKLMSGEVAV